MPLLLLTEECPEKLPFRGVVDRPPLTYFRMTPDQFIPTIQAWGNQRCSVRQNNIQSLEWVVTPSAFIGLAFPMGGINTTGH